MLSKINKIISLCLFIPILILSNSSGLSGFCQMDSDIKLMACCDGMDSTVKLTDVHHASRTCTCHISDNSQSQMPMAILLELSKTNIKKIDKQFENNSSYLTLNLDSINNSKHFEIDSKQRAPADLKIYGLVSSYLI